MCRLPKGMAMTIVMLVITVRPQPLCRPLGTKEASTARGARKEKRPAESSTKSVAVADVTDVSVVVCGVVVTVVAVSVNVVSVAVVMLLSVLVCVAVVVLDSVVVCGVVLLVSLTVVAVTVVVGAGTKSFVHRPLGLSLMPA